MAAQRSVARHKGAQHRRCGGAWEVCLFSFPPALSIEGLPCAGRVETLNVSKSIPMVKTKVMLVIILIHHHSVAWRAIGVVV